VGVGFGKVCVAESEKVRGPEKHSFVQNPVEQIKEFGIFERNASVHN